MIRKLFPLLSAALLLAAACTTARRQPIAGLPPYTAQSKTLHDTIARLDSLFFDAYNTCKLEVMTALIAEDVEFYHDLGGRSTSRNDIVDGVRRNVCGKSSRELLEGSIEVYPIPGYGAVQIGAHRFRNHQEASVSRYARFVHTWKREPDGWKLARVISLH